jgi:hypothetical protein
MAGDGASLSHRPWTRFLPSRRLLIIVAVGLALLTAATVVAVNSRAHLDRTRSSLDATRAELHHTLAQVAGARNVLAAADAHSEAAAHTLAGLSAQLSTDQAHLAQAQINQYSKGVSISELDTCLAGVEQALNQIALGNQSGAATTLDGVAANCRSAEPSGP